MRFIRLAALVGSLVLLVATAMSVVHRRGDIRDDQLARVEQASTMSGLAVRGSVSRLRQDAHLAAVASVRSVDSDDRALAEELVRFFPDAEACVGTTAAGCTGADLFALELVADLASESDRLDDDDADLADGDPAALALLAVDAQSDSVVAVRRISTESTVRTVAVRMPVDQLLDNSVSRSIETIDARVVTGARSQQLADELEPVQSTGGLWTVTETIGSPFVDGAVEVTANVDRSVGIAGDRTLRYVTLLGLGTVLLALAGWTFLVERRQLERRATTDELTQLINRREFERVSEEALDVADRFETGLCVMVIDLNGFKQVNDTLGHQFGDLVLTASSERLVAAVRDTDVVGRWGGDEFVILLPGLAERSAVRNSAERIWNSLAGSPVVGDTVMTGSIGAAIFPRHGTTLDALMRAADVAMYEAKTTGVSHRIADTIAVGESLLSSDDARVADEPEHNDPPRIVNTDDYAGPDRRKSPVPPPPMPPPGMSVLSESAPPDDARVDEPSAL